jgi:hypothetical protein
MMTIFSFGLGQESLTLLYKLGTDTGFYVKHVQGKLLVVGSDTGNEHPHTYAILPMVKAFCAVHNIEFKWVTSDMGYHPRTWKSLTYQYRLNSSIGSAAFRQSCTDNLKVKVVDNYVEGWLMKNHFNVTRKRAYRRYAERYGKFRLILGFAKGEESRTENGNKYDPVWKKATVLRHYPLLEEGLDRQECIHINRQAWHMEIWPSNCMICFYQSDQEVLWLYRNYPQVFRDWVDMETAKLGKYKEVGDKNYGVYGKMTLLDKLDKATKLYGHWTNEMLSDYKFSHGHCQRTTY